MVETIPFHAGVQPKTGTLARNDTNLEIDNCTRTWGGSEYMILILMSIPLPGIMFWPHIGCNLHPFSFYDTTITLAIVEEIERKRPMKTPVMPFALMGNSIRYGQLLQWQNYRDHNFKPYIHHEMDSLIGICNGMAVGKRCKLWTVS